MKFDPSDYNYSYSEWEHIIDECVLGEKNSKILKRKLLDKITFEKLAEEMEMSARGVRYIVADGINKLIKQI